MRTNTWTSIASISASRGASAGPAMKSGSRDLSPKRPSFKPHRAFRMVWHDVHLDRLDFEALLRDMGISVVQSLDAQCPPTERLLRTGMPGRPTSKHLVLKELNADWKPATTQPNYGHVFAGTRRRTP